MELSSTLSTNLWNRSQSTTVSVGCRVGEAMAVRSRVPTTRTCRAKIIVGWFVSLTVGREDRGEAASVWDSDCTSGQRVYGGKGERFKKEESVSDIQAARWQPRSASALGGCDMHNPHPALWAVRSRTCGLADELRGWLEG